MKNLSEFLKNTAGQFASEEVLKICAGIAAVALAVVFFLTDIISTEKAPYVMTVEGILWAYALGQGIVSNVTRQ